MTRTGRQLTAGLAAAVAVLAGVVAAIGIVARGTGTTELVTSVRGETYAMATDGVYAYNAQRVVAEGIGWDAFTLVVAVPLMLVAAAGVALGLSRARFVVAGLFGYFLYQYLEYAVTWAFGPLFLAFVVIYGLALCGLGVVAVGVARAAIPVAGPAFPRRAWPGLLVAMSGLLTLLWLGRVVTGLTTGVDGLLLGETTMTVQALDLGLVVPVSLAVAGLAWTGHRWAAAVSAAYAVTFVTMSAAIFSMLLAAWAVEGSAEVPPLAVFGLATVAGAWLWRRIHRSLEPASASDRRPAAEPAVGVA
jgi:hypothetical protein